LNGGGHFLTGDQPREVQTRINPGGGGVADVLLVANLVAQAMAQGRSKANAAPFDVQVIGLQGRMVKAAGGLGVRGYLFAGWSGASHNPTT
jgi:hypothetical protein